ncbi:MAG: hypothetical protein HOE92_04960 [Euryarchaeota archaeon]|nr:hypothetical protein [Euryarchaeota archaeon]MBT3971549.1 hypothetical protein [Euryarchaeota archaeon]MBT4407640.1 hypothetical protein [Euryarchaeota archaeon]
MDPIMCFRKGKKTKIHLTGGKLEPSSASSWCGLIKDTGNYATSTLDVSLQETDEWTHYCIKCIWGMMYLDEEEDIETVNRFKQIEYRKEGVFVVKKYILEPLIQRVKDRKV